MQTGLSLTDPLVGSRRRLRAGLREPGFEARLAKPRHRREGECVHSPLCRST